MYVPRPEVGKDKKNKGPRGRNSGFIKPPAEGELSI